MLNSRICSLLGIEHPIFQGGMAWIADGKLAAAVSNAGGLGIISAMNAGPEHLVKEIAVARSLTDKPFGVNIMLMSPFAAEVAEVVAREHINVVTTGAGNPAKFISMWQEAGVKVIPVIPSVLIAKKMEKLGAVAVVAEGGESGGHIGELNTMALVPQVCDAVSIPVLAAGGIGDGRGVAAAFMLGAEGAQLGTRFLVADECAISRTYKDKVLAAGDTDTIVTGRRLGHPVRSLKTSFSREYFRMEYDSSVSDEALEGKAVGALKSAVVDGDDKNGCFIAGQIAGLCRKEQSASDIISEIIGEAESLLKGTKWVK